MSTALDLTEGLTAEDREWLGINGKERRLSSNERLISEGEALREIYFVLSGLFSVGSEASESFSTVGPGGILGDMSFLTGNAASATVIALEEGSVVLAVSSETVSSHLAADADFAVRFYRITAMLLSERLRNLIALFITSPTIRTETKTGLSLRGPVRLFTQNQPDFAAIQRLSTRYRRFLISAIVYNKASLTMQHWRKECKDSAWQRRRRRAFNSFLR